MWRKSQSFSPCILGRFSFVSNATNFFIHSLNRFVFFKKCLRVAGFLQLGALYASIRHDPSSKYSQQKNEHSQRQQSWGVWGCSETPAEVLRWDNNFLGSKEHLDWLKIYLNVAEIITVQDYKHTKKLMLMEVHMYSVKAKSQAGNI